MVIKLDMENAFDRVKHFFLFQFLSKFGFDQAFVHWIKACIGPLWIAPPINGRAFVFFKSNPELRQRCPMSLLMYVIMAESMSRKLEEERRKVNMGSIRIVR